MRTAPTPRLEPGEDLRSRRRLLPGPDVVVGGPSDPGELPADRASGDPRRRWLGRRGAAVAVAVVLVPVGWSYGQALTARGTDSVALRSVEWLRDHGGAGIVSSGERWWYSHHQPRTGGGPAAILLRPPADALQPGVPEAGRGGHLAVPANLAPLAAPPLPGEGVWRAAGRLVGGLPAVYETAIRPDPVHPGLATGVAWMDPTLMRAALFAGVQLPGGAWPDTAPIPLERRPSLVGAFNSGFKLAGSHGGYYAEGRTVQPLVAGAASLVIDADGRPTVGEWGRDVTMGPEVASVRQNLVLIIDGGLPVDGLDQDGRGLWGATLGNRLLVWRSGIGVTADGALVYAAGNGLSVASLAAVLVAAGSVRAMELDINSEWTRFFTYDSPDPAQPGAVVGTKLVPDMRSSPTLYLEPETRDFIALFAR